LSSPGLLIVRGPEIRTALEGRERELLGTVELAYRQHALGRTSVPHSTFLRFPEESRNRIIALPAYLGGSDPIAGVKWIASFPRNYEKGLDRASAVVVLNSTDTGVPEAVLEGSIISAKRTAASAALAARTLARNDSTASVGLIGCGLINAEILRFLTAVFDLESVTLFDSDVERARAFLGRIREFLPDARISIAGGAEEVLRTAPLVSFATTAGEPHIESLEKCPPGATILHVSLRDLSVSSILAADNVVDDVDHVCRARTSIHLAEEFTGSRDFIRATLGEILQGEKPARRDADGTVVFSPFGLGILDLAVAKFVRDFVAERGLGTRIDSFLPEPWLRDSPIGELTSETGGRPAK
jgi:2,3-diaminopropionate biosynthesis protein SbnB